MNPLDTMLVVSFVLVVVILALTIPYYVTKWKIHVEAFRNGYEQKAVVIANDDEDNYEWTTEKIWVKADKSIEQK